MKPLQISKLGNVCETIFSGGTPNTQKSEYWGGDYCWLSSGETRNSFVRITEKTITRLGVDNSSTRLALKDDIVIASAGQGHTRGQTSFLLIDCYINQSVISLRADKKKVHPLWLFYNLSNRYDEMRQISDSHSSRGSLTTALLKSMDIAYPSLEDQKKTVKILYDLDQKIENNRRMNETLESMAQAIFKSWFMDFDLVKAKIAALESGGGTEDAVIAAMQAISGMSAEDLDTHRTQNEAAYANLKSAAEAFPSAFIDSSFGPIPEGWEVKKIGNAVDTISKTYPFRNVREVIFLNTGDISEGRFLHENKSDPEILPGQAKKSIQKEDILYSEIRPENKRYAYVYFDASKYVVSTKLMVLRVKSDIPSIFIYFVLTRQNNIDYLQMMAESRSGTFPQITFDIISKVNFLGPENNDLIKTFSKNILEPIYAKIVAHEKENSFLIEIRDTLLPKFLSGEIDASSMSDTETA